jgi:hypothetical protein
VRRLHRIDNGCDSIRPFDRDDQQTPVGGFVVPCKITNDHIYLIRVFLNLMNGRRIPKKRADMAVRDFPDRLFSRPLHEASPHAEKVRDAFLLQ